MKLTDARFCPACDAWRTAEQRDAEGRCAVCGSELVEDPSQTVAPSVTEEVNRSTRGREAEPEHPAGAMPRGAEEANRSTRGDQESQRVRSPDAEAWEDRPMRGRASAEGGREAPATGRTEREQQPEHVEPAGTEAPEQTAADTGTAPPEEVVGPAGAPGAPGSPPDAG